MLRQTRLMSLLIQGDVTTYDDINNVLIMSIGADRIVLYLSYLRNRRIIVEINKFGIVVIAVLFNHRFIHIEYTLRG